MTGRSVPDGLAVLAPQSTTYRPTAMQRLLLIAGVLVLLTGLLWPWVAKVPLGRLPGDILIDRPGLKVYFPLTTMIVVSLVVSAILWLFRR